MTERTPTPLHESLVTLMTSGTSPAERAQARMEVCAEVLRHLGSYVPHPWPVEPEFLPDLRDLTAAEVRAHLKGNKERATQFGTWRMHVTNVEAQNAARLSVLGQTLLTLIELREAFEPESIDQAIAGVGDWVSRVWMTEVPLEGDLRSWSVRVTRNLTVLPVHWRSV